MYQLILTCWLAILFIPATVLGLDSAEALVLRPGEMRSRVSAGVGMLDRNASFALDFSLEIGVADGVQLAAPAALGVRVIEAHPGSGLYLGAGITDLYVSETGDFFYTPVVAIYGQARLGHESAVRGGIDFLGVEQAPSGEDHPFWLRGALAVVIDFGPWVTFAAGVSYQRQIVRGSVPENPGTLSWVGDSRISVGAVRCQPFASLPTLSVHLHPFVDLIVLMSFDVDMNARTSNSWWLLGVELKRFGQEKNGF